MLSILPLLFGLLIARRIATGRDLRDRAMVAAVCTGAWGVIIAESLSIVGSFSRTPVIVLWAVPVVAMGVLAAARKQLPDSGASVPKDPSSRLPIILSFVILAVTLVVALFTPPTTWDSIGYHLPRQVYWIQNHSVAFYPSGDLRQLEMPPLAEYLGAQLMLLSGTDHQANLIQWCAYALTAVAASTIARDLGACALGQWIAAALALFNPAAATQAVNPKNDLVLALWMLTLTSVAIQVWNARRCSWQSAAYIGVTLGLAILTKGTAMAFALPVCVFISIGCFRAAAKRALPMGAVMILIAAAINTPHWVRNTREFGSPMGLAAERGGFPLTNTTYSPGAISSNIIRNLTLHTSTAIPSIDSKEQQVVEELHAATGLDPSDPRTTSRNQKYSIIPRWYSDGASGAPVHLVLAALLAGAICFRKWRPSVAGLAYLIPAVAALIFAIVFKWQPWHARLHIPIVAAVAPLLAVWCERHRVLARFALTPAFVVALAGVLWNEAKPILGPRSILHESREEIMFQTQPAVLSDASAVAGLLARLRPSSVALEVERATCEYPVQRLVLDQVRPAPHLRVLRRLVGPAPKRAGPPDAVITYFPQLPSIVEDAASGASMRWVSGAGHFRVYVPLDKVAAARQVLPLPDFFGWDTEEGLRALEGPYPQWNLPVVRWANALTTKLTFESDGAPMMLVIECRGNEIPSQAMDVLFNGERLDRHEFAPGTEFVAIRIPIDAKAGPNEVKFSFAHLNQPAGHLAVLFRKLQILPTSWIP